MNNSINDTAKTDILLENILKQHPALFNEILAKKDTWNVQIIYTQVNRDASNNVSLSDYYFNVNDTKYFYPASTVKLPVALLALQRLNELKIDKNTTMITEAAHSSQAAVYNDPTQAFGKPGIAHYIKKILMVSDNDAYNRLYEFLGQDYINNELHKKGYRDAQILHRLDIVLTEEENRYTNPVKFINDNGQVVYDQPLQKSKNTYPGRKDFLGKGYYSGGKLIDQPMDFSKKNRLSLESLHRIVKGLVFPAKVPAGQRFNITDNDRQFVLKYMSQFPAESLYPAYDSTNYWDAYCKFLLYGSEKKKLSESVRIFNKVGDAYGHLIDAAYIVDFDKKIEFFLSAVIYCNSDGILNDDQYDYETIGLPFMKNLGKVIYDYEVKRERKVKPDLSGMKFVYDK
ncbi:MAG: serine hydrolase [Chitinophagaceae bacterium]|nr:serine hydrolase [Chitinophagaceae bacterium]